MACRPFALLITALAVVILPPVASETAGALPSHSFARDESATNDARLHEAEAASVQHKLIYASSSVDMVVTELSLDFSSMGATPLERAAYVAAMVTVTIMLGCIYSDRGFGTCLAIVLYVLALSTMSVSLKSVFAHGFKFPLFVTACHFLSTSTVSCLILLYRNGGAMMPNAKTLSHGIVPTAMCTALSIGLANIGLVYCSAHFYEMFSGLTPLVIAGLGVVMGRPIHRQLFVPLVIMTSSLIIVSFGEISFSALAVVCIVIGILFKATKAQLQSILLSSDSDMQQLAPLDLVMWSCLSSFAIIALWSALSEGSAPFHALKNQGAAMAVAASACPACVLNISGLFALKELGPVAHHALGAFKGIIACAGAVMVSGEVIRMQQIAGYSLFIVACIWYNRLEAELKQQTEAATAQERTPLKGFKV